MEENLRRVWHHLLYVLLQQGWVVEPGSNGVTLIKPDMTWAYGADVPESPARFYRLIAILQSEGLQWDWRSNLLD